MRDLQLVDDRYVETAPHRFSNSVDLAIPLEPLFEVFHGRDDL